MQGLIRDKPSRKLSETLSFFFVDEARKNKHKYGSYEEEIADDINSMKLRYYFINGSFPSINAYFYK
jgi:hypothetical protein